MERDHADSVMIALYPAAEVASALALPGGEGPEELHLTLCYLGNRSDLPAEALANLPGRIAELAARCESTEGTINGWGCFTASERTDDKQVLWAGVNLPAALLELRDNLVTACADAGAPVQGDITFVPHITLAYLEPDQKLVPPAIERVPLTFDAVWFMNGPDRIRIPLARAAETAQRMGRELNLPPVGVWDAVCIFGEYQHVTVEGKPVVTVFDASKCRFMLEDFQARKNDLFYDRQHEVTKLKNASGEPLNLDELDDYARGTTGQYGLGQGDGKALAWADALVMIVAGQVVKFVRHSTAPENPPTLEELRRSDGSLPEDGVYARRSAVTSLGADPKDGLPVYRYTSPYFVPMRDGWRLLNLTATNDPRMEGVALAYERGARVAMQRNTQRAARLAMENPMSENKEAPKSAELPEGHAAAMSAAGCAEGDKPEEKLAKMTAYARKMEEAVKASAARKADDEPAMMSEEKDTAPKAGEAKPEDKETPAEATDLQGLIKRMSALEEKNAMLTKELTESRSAMTSFRKMEEASKAQDAQSFARSAIALGRVRADHKGSVEATERWLAAKHIKAAAEAEDLLSAEGTYQVSERIALQRLTSGGVGIGAPEAGRTEVTPGDEVDGLIAKEIKSLQAASQKGDLTHIAMTRVAKQNPTAWARYNNRSGA